MIEDARVSDDTPERAAWETWCEGLRDGDPVVVGCSAAGEFVAAWDDGEHASVRIGSSLIRALWSDLSPPDASPTIDEDVRTALAVVDDVARKVWEAAGSPGTYSTSDISMGRVCAYFRGDGYMFGTLMADFGGGFRARVHRPAPDSGMSFNEKRDDIAEIGRLLAEHIANIGGEK